MNNKKISILGFSADENSSYLKGCADAPPIIMKAFNSDATNKFSESGSLTGSSNNSIVSSKTVLAYYHIPYW